MALSAHLEGGVATAGKPRASRRTLTLETTGAAPAAPESRVLIHNISVTGLLLETAARLKPNERIDVDLPHAGMTHAQVIWSSGDLHGCQFNAPISEAVLSASQLKSAATSGWAAARPPERMNESFGARLQRLRAARRLTLAQVAKQLDVSKPTVWAWEKDRVKPATKRIEALAQTLGVPAAELLQGGDAAALEGLLAKTREQIAAAYAISPDKVRIMIDL